MRQFIPSSFAVAGRDGNGDGVKNPHNMYDAMASTAGYLCRAVGGTEALSDAALRRAYYSYNHSQKYVSDVLGWAHKYRMALPALGTGR